MKEIIAAIRNFEESGGNWGDLHELLVDLFESGSASKGVDAMFTVFERYPTELGAGVFWTMLHGLESLPDYESRLIESVRKAPSDFALLMVHRLLNAGCREVGGVRLLSLLEQVAQDQRVCPEIRGSAQRYLGQHTKE